MAQNSRIEPFYLTLHHYEGGLPITDCLILWKGCQLNDGGQFCWKNSKKLKQIIIVVYDIRKASKYSQYNIIAYTVLMEVRMEKFEKSVNECLT